MQSKKHLLSGFTLTVTIFLLGYRLNKLYEFDPPYVYFWIGMACQFIIAPAVVIETLIKCQFILPGN